jgi:hypothetical protein
VDAVTESKPVLIGDLAQTDAGGDGRPLPALCSTWGCGLSSPCRWRSVVRIPGSLICSGEHPVSLEPMNYARFGGGRGGCRPVSDLMRRVQLWSADGSASDDELASMASIEAYQATGLIVARLDVGPGEALVRHAPMRTRTTWLLAHRRKAPCAR